MQHNPVNEMMLQGLRDCVYPGAVLLVGQGDRRLFFKCYGDANLFSGQPMTRETVFDLASLTKPLATTLAAAMLTDRGVVDLDRSIDHYLPDLSGSDKAAMTARQLLCHQSGLPAHRRFYMRLQSVSRAHRKSAVLDLLKRTPLEGRPGQRVQYSDLGFMLLCRLVEAAAGCPMNQFLAAEVYGPMGLSDLFFVDLTIDQRPSRAYAATELCPVRNRLLVGEVHDDNAWYAGGIDGHAGLFGTAMAVFQLLRHLAADLHGYSSAPLFSKQILAEVLYGV
ncbi:MAG: serine hydrolase, partial [Desulfosarcina sp.]